VELNVGGATESLWNGGITNVSACKLTRLGTPSEEVTCTAATTDYPATVAMPASTQYVVVYCDSECLVSMGEATSTGQSGQGNVGAKVGAGQATTFAVTVSGTTAHDKPHCQSPTAGAVVRFTYMSDLAGT
jgi:hypothetical protein